MGTRPLMHDDRVLDWVRSAHGSTTFTTSVCTGSLDRTAAEASQLMIGYDPQPPFSAGAIGTADETLIERVIHYASRRQ